MEITIAGLSLIISLFTLWVAYLHRGTVRMTRPTILAFAFEGDRRNEPKVFLRTLLYSTSKQGVVIESIFLKLRNHQSTEVLSVWAYGDKGVVRGSGVYVGEQGIEMYHHFIRPKSQASYKFLSGSYDVEIYGVIKGKKRKLYMVELDLTEEMAKLMESGTSIFFDWNPELNSYLAHSSDPTIARMERLLA
jgi:hypothetical protein